MASAPFVDDLFKPGEGLDGPMTFWFWGRPVSFIQDQSYKLTKDGIIFQNIREGPRWEPPTDHYFPQPLPLVLPRIQDERRMWWVMRYLEGWNPDQWFHSNWGLEGPPYEPKEMELGKDEDY